MFTAISLLLASSSVAPTMDVLYSRAGGEELKMDIYMPTADDSAAKSPAVLVIHGGAWMGGKRSDMAEMCTTLAQHGFVAATTSYRLAPKHKWPAMLDDVQTAVRYLRANAAKYNIDPNRIGSAGASAGGHLALLLGFRDTRDLLSTEYQKLSSKTKCVINFFGPTDVTQGYPPSVEPLFQMVLGKPRKDAAAELKDASPVMFIDKDDAPVYTLHGTADPLVPVAQARLLDEKLKAAGVEHQLAIIEGLGHSADSKNSKVTETFGKMVQWLKQKLR